MTLRLYPYHTDLLATAADRILELASTDAPDLTHIVVLVGDSLAATPLRSACLRAAQVRGHAALLGLHVCTLREWVDARAPDTRAPIQAAARRLLLVEALRQYPTLFGDDDPWRVADSLLILFDELNRYHCTVADDESALLERLTRAYGINGQIPAALSREAQIVHQLWQAWRTQSEALGQPDPTVHYAQQLETLRPLAAAEPFYLGVGHLDLIPAAARWWQTRLQANAAEWLLHGYPGAERTRAEAALEPFDGLGVALSSGPPPTALGACLDALFPTPEDDMRTRAARLAQQFDSSPVQERIGTLAADSAEQEARAIDLQVRRWLLAGKRDIGIVTEDRRLARRVRALLERAGIILQDSGGWALSTTSAAACVERWLQCLEEDFAYQPLLDFLQSPFVYAVNDRDEHLNCVYRLERDIIQHENIARGLHRYRTHIDYRRQRLGWPPARVQSMHNLLDRIEEAAQPLLALRLGAAPADRFLMALRDSLLPLGVWERLADDAAGQRLVGLWEHLIAAARTARMTLDWGEFRIWLGRAFEETSFRPSLANGPVQLLNLSQAQLLSFDALVIGACDREHLPGGDTVTAFFNAGVRRELGLPVWEQRLAIRLYQFRRLLEAAPQVLLSWHREEQGEPRLPSPWLEALTSLQEFAFGTGLGDFGLRALLTGADSAVATPFPAPLPAPPVRPRPASDPVLLPERISASAHQHLIDCPYLYFAADCLGLAPPEAVRERLQKSDYGERVHLCLQALHGGVPGLPGPFTHSFSVQRRDAAIALLDTISRAVFARDLEDNFQHRGWLKRWQALIPDYIDWQIARAREWRVDAVEADHDEPLDARLSLVGRLDRIDVQNLHEVGPPPARAILDYKTGRIPKQAEIDDGEAVQLPFYALLAGAGVERVEYLQLDAKGLRVSGGLHGAALAELSEAVRGRLVSTQAALAAGAEMPAWGDPETCRFCRMDGICRRAAWPDPGADPSTEPPK